MVNSGFLTCLVMLTVVAMCTLARAAEPRAHSSAVRFDQIRYMRAGGIAGKVEQIIITPDAQVLGQSRVRRAARPGSSTSAAGIGHGEGLYLIVQLETRNEK